ncbi:ATP-dependent RNA helicase-like protein rok1 [Clohesyomyces aquaticus]|uniref:ATP-dependent RNA helicase ROK1 n=1 Tax=Clohesyomyces aquaticus TaxID=1231657 RepID=A0A1Y1ZVB8_9PLEO|nr:ATP-dependent RNA helicase-like protein rok1 [Clohesyomyces aquaticus]
MNVFKLLSRSGKGPQTSPAQKLPSSGAVANPQLFGHNEAPKPAQAPNTSRKRKRGQVNSEQSSTIPADLDFFGGGSGSVNQKFKEDESSSGHALEKKKKGDDATDGLESAENNVDAAEERYNEDECKRVLRSHKLKVVVLENFGAQEEEKAKKERKEKKKPKKRRLEKEEAESKGKKSTKQQLFPRPLTSFSQLRTRYGISRRLAENIQEQGYKMTTEVQLGALPLLLKNKEETTGELSEISSSGKELAGNIDLLTVAPTGSGKTMAFLIPIINALQSESRTLSESRQLGPRALIVAPTKELASQIVNEARKLTKGSSVKATLMKKGMELVERSDDEASEEPGSAAESDEDGHSIADSESSSEIAAKLKGKRRRADIVKAAIVVATPLALLNGLKHQDQHISELPSIKYMVLDEADVLLDPLFREQTLSIWKACTNPSLRVGLWSATMGSNIEALAVNTINERWAKVSSGAPDLPPRAPLIRLVVGLKDTAIPNITHKLIYAATEQGKLLGLRQLLHPTATPSNEASTSLRPPFLVFTQTIPRAIALHSELLYDIPPEAGGSSRIAVLHADLSSSARESIMTRFRRGEVWVLITTDLLARGVDFRGLNGVVNYDVPNSAAAYVHRVGRTGRAGRKGGVAVTFYTQEDIPYVKNVANVIQASEKLRGKEGGEASVKQWLLDALPTPTKRDKQRLKKRGVEARRTVKDGEGRAKMRISTKSGYERRVENNRRGAKMAGNARGREDRKMVEAPSESEFEGFEE